MRQSAKLLSLGRRELVAGTRVLREPLGQLAHELAVGNFGGGQIFVGLR